MATYKTYTVVRGDTLSEIAQRFGTTVSYLAKLNNITLAKFSPLLATSSL